jgi:hypothetical protein
VEEEVKPIAYLPDLCPKHQRKLVEALKIGPEGPWQSTLAVANIMLFQAAIAGKVVWGRCSKDEKGHARTEDLSLVLAEIGCLACFDSLAWSRIIRLHRKYSSIGISRIIHGKLKDPDWPYLDTNPKEQ